MAKTASTSDQEFLTFLSTMELPDENIFPTNKVDNFRSNPFASSMPNHSPVQSKVHTKKQKLSESLASTGVSVTATEPAYIASSNVISSSFPMHHQIQNINIDKKTPVKVEGRMYIQSFLPTGVQNYTHQSVLTVVGSAAAATLPCVKSIETERKKKKIRNLRDQQRSQSINSQITELRELLLENGKKFEKTDKFSTLQTVMEFILESTEKISSLDAEYAQHTQNTNKRSTIFSHPQINYSSLFLKSSAALATVSIDGKFIDLNEEFEVLIGFSRKELLIARTSSFCIDDDKSLFHILDKPETVGVVCKAMSRLIESSDNDVEKDDTTFTCESNCSFSNVDNNLESNRFWKGAVCSKKYPDVNLVMTITLVKSVEMDVPLLFQCTLSKN